MKFLDILEIALEDKELQFKLVSQEEWSFLESQSCPPDIRKDIMIDAFIHIGISCIDIDGTRWWPTKEQIKNGDWEIKRQSQKPKTKNLFVHYIWRDMTTHGNAVLTGHPLDSTIVTRDDLDRVQEMIAVHGKENGMLHAKAEDIFILNYKWMID